MDYLLPDEATIDAMNEEYSHTLTQGKAHSLALTSDAESVARATSPLPLCILFLYIGVLLGYNGVYGTEIYDAHGSVGGIRCEKGAFGSINNLCTNKR